MLDLLPAERLYLYGDKAYVSTFGVMGAYKRRAGQQLGQQYNEYNAAMSSCRIAVEHGFAHVANLWSFNDFKSQMKIGKLTFSVSPPPPLLQVDFH